MFFLKLGYLTCFFLFLTLAYCLIYPNMEEENFSRAFQVILQLSLFLLKFRLFTTKEEKEAEWFLLLAAFSSVLATLFLKKIVSIKVLLFIVIPLFYFFILFLPSDILPFATLLFYSLEKELAQWAFFLLFQQIGYYSLCFFLEKDSPKKSICPFLIFYLYFFILGLVFYSSNYLHEPARLTALVSGASIIFLCFRRRERVAFFLSFLIYFFSSIAIGVIAIASAPGGDNISCPIPFLFLFSHLFLFLGLFLFQKNIRAESQPLVPLLFGALLYLLPYFPNLEWLKGWIEGLGFFRLLLGFILFVCGEENK